MINASLYLAPACLGAMILVGITPDYYGTGKERHAEPQGH